MQDYAAARRTMVDCQVRTFDVTDLSVIAAFDVTPREIYAPAGREAMAYADVAIPLDGAPGRVMLPPLVLARMLQSFGPLDGLKVLEIGAGTGYGSALLARQIGQKAAREIFFLAREYSAEDMVRLGAVNEAVDHERLEEVALEYAADIARQSPQAIRMLKFAFNLADDGLAGQQVFAGEATRLAYMTDEAVEGKEAFLEKRDPDWSRFPYYF